ncbi:MAG TPA: glycosyltransferase family 2 protein [Anaerolineae bacterium]
MSRGPLRWLALLVSALLVTFNLRRFLFTLAALKPDRARIPHSTFRIPHSAFRIPHSAFRIPHSALILVPCRNEAAALPGLIDALDRLNYPADCLRVALIDDGSTDGTRGLMESAVAQRPGWQAVAHAANVGKARALNAALRQIAFGEIIVVYDADHRPEPDSLKWLVAAFDDPCVAGASGRTVPVNATASLPAYYATVEGLVHQMITMRAKDRLDLAPALLGSNCVYRRCALEEAGGFRPGALLEDSDLTLAFARLGYRLRFVPESVARHQVPETIEGYVKQHVRWGRGFNDVARDHVASTLRDGRLPLRLRIELTLFSLGYLDRLALLAGTGLAILSRAVGRRGEGQRTNDEGLKGALKIAVAMPFVQIIVAFVSERAPRSMWVRFPAIPILFGLDVWVAARSVVESMLNRPRVWTQTNRQRMRSTDRKRTNG